MCSWKCKTFDYNLLFALFSYHVIRCTKLSELIAIIFCRTSYDVRINDDSWPKEAFELISGEVSKTLERLDPWVHFAMHPSAFWCLLSTNGATENDLSFPISVVPLLHVFVLETKAQGRFPGSPAVIKYRVPTKTALQVWSSSYLYILHRLVFSFFFILANSQVLFVVW